MFVGIYASAIYIHIVVIGLKHDMGHIYAYAERYGLKENTRKRL